MKWAVSVMALLSLALSCFYLVLAMSTENAWTLIPAAMWFANMVLWGHLAGKQWAEYWEER